MKIAILASNFIRIPPLPEILPPGSSGSPELILHDIVEELVKRGHNVTLFASGDSKTSAELYWSTKKCLTAIKGFKLGEQTPHELSHISFAYQKIQKKNFDIVYAHCDWLTAPFAPLVKTPTVVTLHRPINRLKKILKYNPSSQYYVSISNFQRTGYPSLNYISTIYHGVNINEYKFNPKPKNHFLVCSRIIPNKGVDLAIKTCKILKKRLYIIGDYPQDKKFYLDYFEEAIKPYLDQKNIIWKEKWVERKKIISYYQQAKALLTPIQWEEPFGLPMIEAMACGTPVIAFNRGSVPEIIKNKETGFIVAPFDKKGKPNIQGLVEAIKKIYQMPEAEYKKMRYNCRKHVEKNFTVDKMVDNYEKVYYKILARQQKIK